MTEPADLFDMDFSRRTAALDIRPETQEDRAFLVELFVACSPLSSILPMPLLEMQARTQIASHNGAHPHAMHRIALLDGQPIGRIMVDWNQNGPVHGVDLAVMPNARRSMAGLHLLRSWLAVADALGRTCTLEVLADNPARHIYRHLGFVSDNSDGVTHFIMSRAPRG